MSINRIVILVGVAAIGVCTIRLYKEIRRLRSENNRLRRRLKLHEDCITDECDVTSGGFF